MNDETSPPPPLATEPTQIENSTDATRGEPLAMRARKRKVELEAALAKLPADEKRARNDIELALGSLDALLTGDVDNLAETTAANISRVLESSKHLAEVASMPSDTVTASPSPDA